MFGQWLQRHRRTDFDGHSIMGHKRVSIEPKSNDEIFFNLHHRCCRGRRLSLSSTPLPLSFHLTAADKICINVGRSHRAQPISCAALVIKSLSDSRLCILRILITRIFLVFILSISATAAPQFLLSGHSFYFFVSLNAKITPKIEITHTNTRGKP